MDVLTSQIFRTGSDTRMRRSAEKDGNMHESKRTSRRAVNVRRSQMWRDEAGIEPSQRRGRDARGWEGDLRECV